MLDINTLSRCEINYNIVQCRAIKLRDQGPNRLGCLEIKYFIDNVVSRLWYCIMHIKSWLMVLELIKISE